MTVRNAQPHVTMTVRVPPDQYGQLREMAIAGKTRSPSSALVATSQLGLEVEAKAASGALDDPKELASLRERWRAALSTKDVAAFTQSLTDSQWQAILAQRKLDEDARDAEANKPVRHVGNAPPGMIHAANAVRILNPTS